jgi:hypothetical protein
LRLPSHHFKTSRSIIEERIISQIATISARCRLTRIAEQLVWTAVTTISCWSFSTSTPGIRIPPASTTGCGRSWEHPHNWVQDLFQKRTNAAEWLGIRSQEDVETFYNVATGMLLELDAIRFCPELTKFAAHSTPQELWAVFCSPFVWFWKVFDWNMQWKHVLRQCSETSNGYPLNALPIRIPTFADHTGEYSVDWSVPYRW